jgi:methanogenic corrinoid protein MtbC1
MGSAPGGGAMKNRQELPAVKRPPRGGDTFRDRLALALEEHVPAKLEQTYQDAGHHRLLAAGVARRTLSRADIAELTDAFLVSEPGAFLDVLDRQGLSALSFADFYMVVIMPVANALGELWCDDRAGFLAVSIATERLRLAVDALYPQQDIATRHASRSALITTHEGMQHTFGAYLLSKAFVFADWLVTSLDWNDASGSPYGHVSRNHFDFVGLSVGVTSTVPDCRAVIASLRTRSCNPNLVVGLGGPGPALDPLAFATCGADFIACDAIDAIAKAEEAVAAQPCAVRAAE